MSNALAILLSFATALSVVGCDVSPTNTATPLSDNNQPQTQTESYTDTQFQTEAEVIATDGLLFAQSYDLPAPIAIKRFMFEHHQDFFEPKEQLLAHYQDRLISHGFATDTTDGGHYQIILTAGDKPQNTQIVRKGKPTQKPAHSDIDADILAIATQLLETDTALPVRFVVTNISQQAHQSAQQKLQNTALITQLRQKIPNIYGIQLTNDDNKLYAHLSIGTDNNQPLDKAQIAKTAKAILGLDILIDEVAKEHFSTTTH